MPTDSPGVERLQDVRNALLKLHKTLLDSERAAYEAKYGRVPTAGAMLNLVLGDAAFAYLRPISELIVQIDEAMEAEEPMSEEAIEKFLTQVRRMLRPVENETGLGQPYFDAMQRELDVVLAHAAVTKLL